MDGYVMQKLLPSTGINHAEMHVIQGVNYLVISSGNKLDFYKMEENELILYKSITTHIPVIYFSIYKTKTTDGLILFSKDGQFSIYTFESNIYAHERNLKGRVTILPITPQNYITKIVSCNKITVVLFSSSLITIIFQQSGRLNIQADEKYFLNLQIIDLLVTNSLFYILIRSTSGRVNLYIYSIKNAKTPLTLLKVIPTQSDILFGKNTVFLNGNKGIKDLINDSYITNINLLDQITACLETSSGVLYTTPRGELIGIGDKVHVIYHVFDNWIDELIEVSADTFLAVSKQAPSYLFKIVQGGYNLEQLYNLEYLEKFPNDSIEIISVFEHIGEIQNIEYKNFLKIQTNIANYEYKKILNMEIKNVSSGAYNNFFYEEVFILNSNKHSYIYNSFDEYVASLDTTNKIKPIIKEQFMGFLTKKDKYYFISKKSIFYTLKSPTLKLKQVNLKNLEIIKVYKYEDTLFICLNSSNNLNLYKFDFELMKFNIIPMNIPMNKIINIQYLKHNEVYLFITFEGQGYYVNKDFDIIETIKCHIIKEYVDINKYNIIFKHNELILTNTLEINLNENGIGDNHIHEDTLAKLIGKNKTYKLDENLIEETSLLKQAFEGVIDLETCLIFYGKECLVFNGKEFYYLKIKNVLKIENKENILYILTTTGLFVAENWELKEINLIKIHEENSLTKNKMRYDLKSINFKIKNKNMKSCINFYKKKKKIKKILIKEYISGIYIHEKYIFICHGAYLSIFKVYLTNLVLQTRIIIPVMPIKLHIINQRGVYLLYLIDISYGFTVLEYNIELKYAEVKTREDTKIIHNTLGVINNCCIFTGGENGICLFNNCNINYSEIKTNSSLNNISAKPNNLLCKFALNLNEEITCSFIKKDKIIFGTKNGTVGLLIPLNKEDWSFLLIKMKQFSQNFIFDFYDSISVKYSNGIYYSNIIDINFMQDFPINIFKFSNATKKKLKDLLKNINTGFSD